MRDNFYNNFGTDPRGLDEDFDEIDSDLEENNDESYSDDEDISESEEGTELSEDDVDEESTTETEEDDEIESEEDEHVEAENTDEDEWEEVEVPEWISDDYIVPEFKNQKAELDWYRKQYGELLTMYSKENFLPEFTQAYMDVLISKEKEVENLKAMDAFAKGDPELFIKMYNPQILASKGLDSNFTDEEIYKIIDNTLKKEFGEDYLLSYDENFANNPNTVSGRMLLRQKQIQEQIAVHQENARKIAEETRPLTKEQLDSLMWKEYEEDFKNQEYTKEEFVSFVKEVQNKAKNLKLKDLHRALYHKEYMQQAYENGKKAGKLEATKNLKTAKQEFSTESDKKHRPTIAEQKQIPFYLRDVKR